ncbi:MAG: tetratricopeptide repeat protein [Nitrospirae bacterium]|nr:tetratricopeptide repeat protein [Nitrospirota bacterium]
MPHAVGDVVKVKYRGFKGDVPPNLKHTVLNSSERYATKRKIIFLSVLVFAAVVSGVGAVYIIDLYNKPYKTKNPTRHMEKSQEQVVSTSTPPTAMNSPRDIASKPVNKTIGFDAGTQKKNIEKKVACLPVKRYQKKIRNETSASLPESEISAIPTIADDKKKLSEEDISKRDVYIFAAQAYESKRDYYNAIANYKKASGIDAKNHAILNNIASVLLRLDSYNEAIPYLNDALSIEKDYVPALVNLGIAYAMLGNFQEGEGYLAKALTIDPSNVYAILNLAISYERHGDNDKAYSFFYKLYRMGNIQGYLGTARVAEKQGRIRDAVTIYREIMAMNGIDPKIKKLADERLTHLQKN